MVYKVKCIERTEVVVEVDASSEQEAISKAEEGYGDIVAMLSSGREAIRDASAERIAAFLRWRDGQPPLS